MKEKFDLHVISHSVQNAYILDEVDCLAINLVHSKFKNERPIKHHNIIGRLACREDVIERWLPEYDFDGVLLNPFDLSKLHKSKKNNGAILCLGSLDPLRLPMIYNLVRRSLIENKKLILQGKQHFFGSTVQKEIIKNFGYLPNNIEIKEPTEEPYEAISEVDEVAGIFIGRVTIEAIAIGKKASVYDEKGRYYFLENYDVSIHDYLKVADDLLEHFKIMKKANTVDIVLVRFGKKKMEDECIKTIKKYTLLPINIVEIDNWEKNEGLSTIWNRYLEKKNHFLKNEYVCVINTDAFITKGWLEKMMQTMIENEEVGIVGPSGDNVFAGQGKLWENVCISRQENYVPSFISGYCMLLRKVGLKFPEQIPFYHNDQAICDLYVESGYRLVHRSDAFVYHLDQKSQTESEHSKLGEAGVNNYKKWNETRDIPKIKKITLL